jgi:hypothetical protein
VKWKHNSVEEVQTPYAIKVKPSGLHNNSCPETHLGHSRISNPAHPTNGPKHGSVHGKLACTRGNAECVLADVKADDFEEDARARVSVRVS